MNAILDGFAKAAAIHGPARIYDASLPDGAAAAFHDHREVGPGLIEWCSPSQHQRSLRSKADISISGRMTRGLKSENPAIRADARAARRHEMIHWMQSRDRKPVDRNTVRGVMRATKDELGAYWGMNKNHPLKSTGMKRVVGTIRGAIGSVRMSYAPSGGVLKALVRR